MDPNMCSLQKPRRLLTAFASLAIFWVIAFPSETRAQNEERVKSAEPRPVVVEVVKPSRQPVERVVKIPGTLAAFEQVDLFAKASGYVERINVDIGDVVRAGEELVRLSVPEMADELRRDKAIRQAKEAQAKAVEAKAVQAQRRIETARAEAQQADAKHKLDELNLSRQQELRKGNAIAQQALDEAVSAHAVAEAQVQISQARMAAAHAEKLALDADVLVAKAEVEVARATIARLETLMNYASIEAPFDGVITKRSVDHGSFVRSAATGEATTLLRISKTDTLRAIIEVPEADATYVRVGTPVDINLKALGGPGLSEKVSRTARSLRPETRTMRVEVDVENKSGKLAPGMYVEATLHLESRSHAMVIPSKAIRVQGKNTVVLVSANGVATTKPVEIGYDDGIWAEVLTGLEEEDMVITALGGSVSVGDAVSPVLSGS